MKISINYDYIFYTFLMTFYIYNVEYKFIPVSSYIWSLLLFLLLFLLLILKNKNIYINKKFILSLVFFSFFLFFSIISLLFNIADFDLSVLKILSALIIALIIVPVVLYIKFKNNPLLLLRIIASVGIINALFIIGMFFIPEFKNLYQNVVISSIEKLNGEIDLENYITLRKVGINGFSAYSTAVIQIVLVSIYVLYININNNKPTKIQLFNMLMIIISAIIAARTSFVLLPFFLLYYFYMFGAKDFLKLLSILVIFLLLAFSLVQLLLEPKLLEFFMNWVTELFIKGSSSGSLQSNISMYHYGFNDFSLFGDFKLRNDTGGYHMNTDVGWYRFIFTFGILGLVIFIFYLYFITLSGKLHKVDLALLLILLVLGIAMFKGIIIFDAFSLLSLLVVLKLLSPKLNYLRKSNAQI